MNLKRKQIADIAQPCWRYGHTPIRSDTSIRVYTMADTDTSTACVGVSATYIIRPGRSLRTKLICNGYHSI